MPYSRLGCSVHRHNRSAFRSACCRWTVALLLTSMISSAVYGQKSYRSFYISVMDTAILSNAVDREAGAFFKGDSLNRIVSRYEVLKFRRAFPFSSDEELQRIWVIASDEVDMLYLAEQLHSAYPALFPFIEEDVAGCNCLQLRR